MPTIDDIRAQFPEAAKDIKLNLQGVLGDSSLDNDTKWGVAIACALATRQPALRDAIMTSAQSAGVSDNAVIDAQAAATLMAMNNVFYRFRHMMEKEAYNTMPAGLRMNHMAKPLTGKASFELMSLAVSAMNGCQMCLITHEQTLLKHGVTEKQINDAVRIASVMSASACALDMVTN